MRDRRGPALPVAEEDRSSDPSERHPDKWLLLYSQVTFSDIPYSVALPTGCGAGGSDGLRDGPGLDIDRRWDSPEVERMVLEAIVG